jgi:transcription termination factor NusB
MKLPKMSPIERAVLAATFAREMEGRSTPDNRAAEEALEVALWEVQCFRQALRDRKKDG